MQKRSILLAASIVAITLSAGMATAQAYDAPAIAKSYDSTPVSVAAVFVHSVDAAPMSVADLVAAAAAATETKPHVELHRAAQYAVGQLARQRPEVTPTWRDCPSI